MLFEFLKCHTINIWFGILGQVGQLQHNKNYMALKKGKFSQRDYICDTILVETKLGN